MPKPKSTPTLEERPHKGKRHTGKSAKGKKFEPGRVLPAAPALDIVAQLNRPRPSTSRYPIDQRTFAALEAAATKVKLPARKASTLVMDKGKKAELALSPGMALPAAPAVLEEPAEAPVALGNFQGIADTGWFPPDCTMAAGPQHVMLAVNSSVAIYTKAGAVAQAARTLSTWFGNVISQAKIFDPRLLYDQHANRWLLVAAALPSDPAVQQSFFLFADAGNKWGTWVGASQF